MHKSTKKKTHDQFIYEMGKINQDIQILSTYKNSSTKIQCRCLIDSFIWFATPNALLRGSGCPKCKSTNQSKNRSLSHEEFMKRMEKCKLKVNILSKYINSHEKLYCLCLSHNEYFYQTPAYLLKNIGCKKCGKENKSKANSLKYKDFIIQLEENISGIILIGEYANATTTTTFKCMIDGHEWSAKPHRILKGSGCPKCAGMIKTNEEFLAELYIKNPNLKALELYKGSNVKILFECLLDNHRWMTTPSTALRISGCPKCKKEVMKKHLSMTQSEFINRMKSVNSNIKVIGSYINIKTKLECKCLIHNYIWNALPGHLLNGHGCTFCVKSNGENLIKNILSIYNINTIPQKRFFDCKNKRPLPFDFYLPDFNVCIEYHGIQHFKPIKRFGGEQQFIERSINDNIKKSYCLNNNIKLIEIPYWDFKNIEKILTKELNINLEEGDIFAKAN